MTATTATPLNLSEAYGQFFWSTDQYEQLHRSGILREDKVELLFGQIVQMSPLGKPHNACLDNLEYYFGDILRGKFRWWTEKPIQLTDGTMPQPDFCVIKHHTNKAVRDYPTAEEVVIVIEVADSSLEKDQNLKSVVYAQAGIREYWIANLVDRQLEVYTEPTSDGKYRVRRLFEHDAVMSHDLLGTVDLGEVFPF